jgi:protein TonB
MKSVLFCCIFLIQSVVFSQQDTTIYSIVDKEVEFTGGFASMNAWLLQNMNFFEENELPNSQIMFELIIEADGILSSIENFRGLRLTPESKEQLISTSPKWTPAQLNGRNVRSKYLLPMHIDFN